MAPEQVRAQAEEIGPAADIYALGAMLFEMLTSRPPFVGKTPMEILWQVISVEPLSPRQFLPAIPRDLDTICVKCLEKDPRKRYVTALELAEDLQRFRRGDPIVARPLGPVERLIRWSRRQPALAAASALAGIALLATVVVSLVFAANKNADAHHLNQLNANLVDREKETATALEEKRAELDARQKAEQARIAEEKQRRRFNRMSTILALDRGVNFCEQGDVRHGLMWLVRALEIEPDDAPDLDFAIRFNLAAWRPSLGELLGRLDHPGTVHAAQLAPGARAGDRQSNR